MRITILENTHFANIAYEGFLLDGKGGYIRDCPVDKDLIQRARLKTGVYQTLESIMIREQKLIIGKPTWHYTINLN